MSKKLSRRDFAKTSVAAGAAAIALPGTIAAKTPTAATTSVAAKGAAVARRRLATLPPEVAYGGRSLDGRDIRLEDTLTPGGTAPAYAGGWREGTTIPGEYYVDEKHYVSDERFIKEHFWLMVDHESRIPRPGDYFVFEFGRGESVILVRDQAGAVRAFHNVCRHRGSRLCMHGPEFDNIRPSEAKPDGKPVDPKSSVVQLGSSGNTPVFRCPYHAWTYDTSGRLISFPPGMPSGFDQSQHGLHPAYLRMAEGFIYVNFSKQEPPDFDAFVANWRNVAREYGTAQLKVVARRPAPTKANWKLVLENFRECYHCQPAHSKSYLTAHWYGDRTLTPEQIGRIEDDFAKHGHAAPTIAYQPRDQLNEPVAMAGALPNHLRPGYVTGSLDGKPVAPLLPGRSSYSHRSKGATTGFSTGFMHCYDDHVAVVRFTPRGVMSTDAEIFYLVHPDAKEKDVDIERMVALWYNTYREDRWIVENNHHGILNGWYSGGQPYATHEGGPSGLAKWYMTEVVPHASDRQTQAG